MVKILFQQALSAQQKLGSLKTLPSAKIKQLIADEVLKNYLVLYSIMVY